MNGQERRVREIVRRAQKGDLLAIRDFGDLAEQQAKRITELEAERDEAEKRYLAGFFAYATGKPEEVTAKMVEDMDNMKHRADALQAALAELRGLFMLVMQVVDGGTDKPDPDYECSYCGRVVSDGHSDHCIVPEARDALAAGHEEESD